jgi:hypothetical protein
MSATRDHGSEHVDLVCLHAMGALGPAEAREAEANLAACATCREELQALLPVIDAFVVWPTDVVRPSASLWGRLSERIEVDAGAEPGAAIAPQRWMEPEWREVAPGISCMLLAVDATQDRVSMLVRLAPGVAYPAHRHAGVEELHLLYGELVIDERTLHPGDCYRAEPGSADQLVRSETGCTCFLTTSSRDELR